MKLFTKTICPKCMLVKNTLERNNLNYEIINIDEVPQAREQLLKNGFMSVPVLFNGESYQSDVSEILASVGNI